ncbi:VOC family protein [Marinobacter sp. M1N3S26]|uniref:VOC family protein n=1 Tax=Marinobacter sp. M1N3S26 TaxID=3382299 RepID=UPI00387B12CA
MAYWKNRQGHTRSRFLTTLMALLLTGLLSACEWELFDKNADGEDDDDEPTPVASQVTGLELGVSDLDMSLPVYRNGLDMRIVDETTTDNSRRITLESPGSPLQEATLTLIEFTDGLGRNLQDNPGKIVFVTPDAEALANQFERSGGVVTLPPEEQSGFGVVGFGRDPDNNLIEIAESSDAPLIMLGAVGIGVSNLDEARDFYRDQVGLTEQQFLETSLYDEYIMGTPEGRSSLSLVLMHWTDDVERRYQGNVTRVRLISEDPEEVTERTLSEEDDQTQDLDGNQLIIDDEPADLTVPDSGD